MIQYRSIIDPIESGPEKRFVSFEFALDANYASILILTKCTTCRRYIAKI